MKNKDRVAIVIVNWNTYKLTRSCIVSLNKCVHKNFEIFLVDNNSSDESVKKLKKEFKDLHFILNNNNTGFCKANNQAIEKILYEKTFNFIMLLNSDTEVSPFFIKPLIDTFKSNEKIGAVQPLILNWSDKSTIWKYEGDINRTFGITSHRNKNKIFLDEKMKSYTEWASGCCIFTTPSIFKEVGLFDEIFFAYYEDVDWSIRLKKQNYLIALSKLSEVYHHESGSSKSSKKQNEGYLSPKSHYYNFRNHIILLRKHKSDYNSLGIVIFQLLKITLFSLYFILRLRKKKFINLWKGVYDGLRVKI
jgi:GT2 family glycosyltransferase